MSDIPIAAKRQRAASISPPSNNTTSKSARISSSGSDSNKEIICKLPPTCHIKPTVLDNTIQLESHYSKCHAHVCADDGCGFIFPDSKFLELHQTECHDPIAAIRKEKGERTFACFDSTCESIFRTPKGRRLHLIDKHKYPSNFYFSVTNYGIGRSLSKWGEGASLLRKEWKPRPLNVRDREMSDTTTTSTGDDDTRWSTTKAQRDPVDSLADSMSSLSIIPPSIHFGRGGMRGGFQRVARGNNLRIVNALSQH